MEYRITAPELNQLEKSLSQLKIINEKSQKKLMLLKNELATLKQTSQTQTALLQSANKSLATYAAEEKKRQRVIKTQRNVAYGLSAILLYALVRK